jgi:hypothetical protein
MLYTHAAPAHRLLDRHAGWFGLYDYHGGPLGLAWPVVRVMGEESIMRSLVMTSVGLGVCLVVYHVCAFVCVCVCVFSWRRR